ncbi:hypothetical protein [Neobacillus drentensis]|uniref:hypothetical protein n=1 Tax=Neobacillus drentensis TaxID=220684 RepID=UPI002FFFE80B
MKDIVEMIYSYIQMAFFLSAPLAFLIWIVLGFKRKTDRKKEKDTTKTQLILCTIFIVVASPIAFFIGGMATDSADDSDPIGLMFLQGFSFIMAYPLFCLLVTITKWFVQRFRA